MRPAPRRPCTYISDAGDGHTRGAPCKKQKLRARDRGSRAPAHARKRKRALGRLSSLLDHFAHGQRLVTLVLHYRGLLLVTSVVTVLASTGVPSQ